MSGEPLLLLVEVRVDFSAESGSVTKTPLRPLPVHCPLPHETDGPEDSVVGWIQGALYSSASYAITVSSASVTSRTPRGVHDDPSLAFELADPARRLGLLYLCEPAHEDPSVWQSRFLSDLRYDASLDIAGINDSRARSITAGARRSGRKPVFVRVAARTGGSAIETRAAELGRVRRPYCVISASVPASKWTGLLAAVVEATRAAVGHQDKLSVDTMDQRLQAWVNEADGV